MTEYQLSTFSVKILSCGSKSINTVVCLSICSRICPIFRQWGHTLPGLYSSQSAHKLHDYQDIR